MARISLFFCRGKSRLQLEKTLFEYPLLEGPQKAVRGKTSGAHRGSGSFQWTPALQALCIFLLRARLDRDAPQLEGEGATPASSLDYALSKQPNWLFDIFGSDSKGNLLLLKLVNRTNPNRKRGGSVALSLQPKVQVEVFLDGKPLETRADVAPLLKEIQKAWKPIRRVSLTDANQVEGRSDAHLELPQMSELTEILRTTYEAEVRRSVSSSDVFSPLGYQKTLESIYQHPSFERIIGTNKKLLESTFHPESPAERLGVSQEYEAVQEVLFRDKKLRVAVGCLAAGATAIFRYLKYQRGYPFEIVDKFVHAVEISQHIMRDKFYELPDLCVLGLAPMATLLSQKRDYGYRPVCLLPNVNHRVLMSSSAEESPQLDYGRFLFHKEDPSLPEFCFDDLARAGRISKQAVSTVHADPDEIFQMMRGGDPDLRAIVFFPHCLFNRHFNGSRFFEAEVAPNHKYEFVLMAHESFLRDRKRVRALDILIRDAWLSLREDQKAAAQIADSIVSDRALMSFLRRAGGLAFH